MRKSEFPWFLALFIGAAGATVYWLMLRDQRDPGLDIWTGLGFPYGPAGNLTSMQSQYFTGRTVDRPDGHQARPVTISPSSILTDLLGNPLTDLRGDYLFDLRGPINVFPTYNAAALNTTLNMSGSEPS